MPVPTLLDYQFWFGFDGEGKVFGIDTDIDVVSVEGLESVDINSGTRDSPLEDGAVPGLHLVTRKMPIFELEILGSEYASMIEALRPERNHEGELHWRNPERGQVWSRARVFRRPDNQDGLSVGLRPMQVAFEIADPRIYGEELKTQQLGIWNPSGGGIDWEIDWEVDFSGGGSGTDVVATNAGNNKAYPVIKFFGPVVGDVDGVLLQNLTTGIELEIVTAISTGQVLTADMDARVRGTGTRVIDLAGASRYGSWSLPRDTFYLQPGDNTIRFSLTGGTSTDALASLTWRDTSY